MPPFFFMLYFWERTPRKLRESREPPKNRKAHGPDTALKQLVYKIVKKPSRQVPLTTAWQDCNNALTF